MPGSQNATTAVLCVTSDGDVTCDGHARPQLVLHSIAKLLSLQVPQHVELATQRDSSEAQGEPGGAQHAHTQHKLQPFAGSGSQASTEVAEQDASAAVQKKFVLQYSSLEQAGDCQFTSAPPPPSHVAVLLVLQQPPPSWHTGVCCTLPSRNFPPRKVQDLLQVTHHHSLGKGTIHYCLAKIIVILEESSTVPDAQLLCSEFRFNIQSYSVHLIVQIQQITPLAVMMGL